MEGPEMIPILLVILNRVDTATSSVASVRVLKLGLRYMWPDGGACTRNYVKAVSGDV